MSWKAHSKCSINVSYYFMGSSYPSWGKNEFLPSYRGGDWGSARIDVICMRIQGHSVFYVVSPPLLFIATGMACYKLFVVVQSLSCVWLFATPWTAAHQASLSFTISWSLLKFMSIESVILPNHLILCQPPPAFSFSQHQGLSHESALHIRWPMYWSFSFSNSLFNEDSGLIFFRID